MRINNEASDRVLKRFLVIVALVGAAACDKNPNGPDGSSGSGSGGYSGTTTTGSTLLLFVDGKPYTATALNPGIIAGSNPEILEFAAVNTTSTFALDVPAAVGSYTITRTPFTAGFYTDLTGGGAGWWAFNGIGGAGTLQITARTATTISGNFDLTLLPLSGAATTSLRVNGSFVAKIA